MLKLTTFPIHFGRRWADLHYSILLELKQTFRMAALFQRQLIVLFGDLKVKTQ